jgi:hypothetical protein
MALFHGISQFDIIHYLGVFNILMGVLNMIPILPFDGGNALVAILWRKQPQIKARRLVAHLGLILGPALFIYGIVIDQWMLMIFGLMGAVASVMTLLNSGGIRFGEALQDRRARKEEEAFKRRQKQKTEDYLADVAARAREREEQERLRKLIE